jgi:hypothetical protein
MFRSSVLVLGATLACGEAVAQAAKPLPPDVARFAERRDGCDHFRGEEPYDEERRAFLEQRLRELCTGTDRALARLKRKYRDDPAVMAVLERYEQKIESAPER